MTVKHPFDELKAAIHADPDYAWGWQCNLAVPMRDVIPGVTHAQANRAAALIMRQLFDYDITTHKHYDGGKSAAQKHFELRIAAEQAEDAAA